ncbi:MAG TPA: electron transfer flavoprotein subunit beta/FixA family protein [Clostridia bacterium]|nr:electron transfer flavoprotein subunit beta/FixA family protein [Clostridia bacterium]
MNILVCVKRVPLAAEVKFDPITHTLLRDSVPTVINPFDAFALEAALTLKDQSPADTEVALLCMGPEESKRILKKGLSAGADRAFLISGRFAAGSDTLATSYILSSAVKCIEQTLSRRFDLILTGKQSTDGDTAQVGPQLAEHLGYGQITCVSELTAGSGTVTAKQEHEGGYALLEADLPCVVTVAKTQTPLRTAARNRQPGATPAEIVVIEQETLGQALDLSRCGLSGSPTVVQKTFVSETKNGVVLIRAATETESAKKLVALLNSVNMI